MNAPLRIFPPGLVGGDGRRLRLGSRVSTSWEGRQVVGEIVGWSGQRGVEVYFDEEPGSLAVQPVDLVRVDEAHPHPVTVGWQVVEDLERSTVLVCPIGNRDVVWRSADDRGPFAMVEADGQRQTRRWADLVVERCRELGPRAANEVYRYIDLPMIRRVLDEASLPSSVARLSLVLTDQEAPQPTDTAGLAEIIGLWLTGRGHMPTPHDESFSAGNPLPSPSSPELDESARPVDHFGPHLTVRRMPHQMDAVIHQIRGGLADLADECEQLVAVLAGGTPGTKYGLLLACAAIAGPRLVRCVQVPDEWRVDDRLVEQPLIELDLLDMAIGQLR